METTNQTLKALCEAFVKRSKELGYKDKRRDTLAMEFFIGATLALDQADHAEAFSIRLFTVLLLATRGYSEIVKVAESQK